MLALLRDTYVTFGKLLNLSYLQFPHLQNGSDNTSFLTGMPVGTF